jgi:hypothetical protein
MDVEEGDDIEENTVLLNLYDLNSNMLKANNIFTDVLAIGGAYHAGVEVYGKEYMYGEDGLVWDTPRFSLDNIYKESVVMGQTLLDQQAVDTLVLSMQPHWLGKDYHIVSNNCCAFARKLCRKLKLGDIPAWVDRLAHLADRAIPQRALRQLSNKDEKDDDENDELQNKDFNDDELQN